MIKNCHNCRNLEWHDACNCGAGIDYVEGEANAKSDRNKRTYPDNAAPSATAVEQPRIVSHEDMGPLGTHTVKAYKLVAPQAADTDKVREAQANPHATTFPNEIWLNVGDGDAHEVGPYKDLSELSWCWERIDKYDVRYVRADLAAATAMQAPVREVPDMRPGVEAVIKLIQKQCDAYHCEHGSQEPDTGAWNYPGNGADWICDREELLDEIRALLPVAPVQQEGDHA